MCIRDRCTGCKQDDNGNVVEVYCEYDPDSKTGMPGSKDVYKRQHFHRGLQTKLRLVLILQGDIPHVGHLVHRRSLERNEHIILVRLQELIRGRHHIILIAERRCV